MRPRLTRSYILPAGQVHKYFADDVLRSQFRCQFVFSEVQPFLPHSAERHHGIMSFGKSVKMFWYRLRCVTKIER